ncbi:TRAP transporter small permease subunit [Aliikangiella marina]|uniref:TRAP transporter small permease protein n=1 Tax=Aliikangiella marina TaxID=1712262 RepID=A0A545TD30_9GAMM|nr:TRAP transporter small permease subunit [Aliikangiella marina]TQV75128.1 TRAP transporter small permease subunit [Aliikangiella marina]
MQRLLNQLHRIEQGILWLMLVALIAAGLLQVILRNVFDTGILWNETLIRVLVLWLTLLGALCATVDNRHIKINIFDRLIPKPFISHWQSFLHLVSASVCFLVAYYSFGFVLEEYSYGEIAFGVVPVWVTESIIPIGFGLMGLRFAIQMVTCLTVSKEVN